MTYSDLKSNDNLIYEKFKYNDFESFESVVKEVFTDSEFLSCIPQECSTYEIRMFKNKQLLINKMLKNDKNSECCVILTGSTESNDLEDLVVLSMSSIDEPLDCILIGGVY